MAPALSPEVILWTFSELRCVFVPRDGGVVEGQLALEGGGVAFADLDASDAFSELNLVGYSQTIRADWCRFVAL